MFPRKPTACVVTMTTLLLLFTAQELSALMNMEVSVPNEPPLKPCCWPSKMAGTMVVTAPDMHLFSITFYADFDQGRSIDIPGSDSGIPMVFNYRDLKNKRRYLKFKDGTCRHYAMVDDFAQCIPEDAKLVNTLRVEKEGKLQKLLSWEFTATLPDGGHQSRIVFSDNCHPFIYRLEDPMVGYKFENVVATLDDYSVFDVDLTGCEKGD